MGKWDFQEIKEAWGKDSCISIAVCRELTTKLKKYTYNFTGDLWQVVAQVQHWVTQTKVSHTHTFSE